MNAEQRRQRALKAADYCRAKAHAALARNQTETANAWLDEALAYQRIAQRASKLGRATVNPDGSVTTWR